MRGLLIAGLLSLLTLFGGAESASANCTTPCTKAQVTTDINTNWPDNTSQLITPALLRSTVLDLVNSYLDTNGSASFACPTNQWINGIPTLSTYNCLQINFSNLAGSSITWAEQAAPSTPSAGNGIFWFDSTDHRLHDLNSSGVKGTTAVPQSVVAGTFLTGMTNAGVFGTATAMTSLTPAGGLVSSNTAACSQTAVTGAGTFYRAGCIDSQSGTSFAIPDGDRFKLITGTNAAAQAYTIAQAGAASAFQAGWCTDIQNNSSNVAGIITITATTSTFSDTGTTSTTIQPGQFARICSDGTNYQVTFKPNARQLPGTATNDAANAGNVGEYIQSVVASGSAISLSNNTPATVTSISLTAGDWDVSGNISFTQAGTTSVTGVYSSLSLTTNTMDNTVGREAGVFFPAAVPGAGTSYDIPVGPLRFSVSTTTTVFLVANSNFTVSTQSAFGIIRARRVR